jgi:hypothetical protein
MGDGKTRPAGENDLQRTDLTSSEPELETLRAGEELLRKAHAVSHQILSRFRKAMEPEHNPKEDVILLAQAFRRLYKVMARRDQ